MAEVFDMNGTKREGPVLQASPSINSVISDIKKLNNEGQLKCVLVTMVFNDADEKVSHCFGTTGVSPLSLIGGLELAKHFYINNCLR